ncbi:hypothetical protein L227DRAFT_54370 [Lentinus tigrinus ALCF2SS1-6]|uniref:Uncharacterized protein n=1 Tax=Lentinus tigrinus ALCF2SS1-6 TaxID=1328759 RepID=A0A5C2SEL8_9APHY|nr:hypothetical protein L227DRAFT_54370 [Lentinus tigrinus ALCF2SS1-6]
MFRSFHEFCESSFLFSHPFSPHSLYLDSLGCIHPDRHPHCNLRFQVHPLFRRAIFVTPAHLMPQSDPATIRGRDGYHRKARERLPAFDIIIVQCPTSVPDRILHCDRTCSTILDTSLVFT